MKGVQCYELFGGIALKNRTFHYSPDSGFEFATCKSQKQTSIIILIIMVIFKCYFSGELIALS